MLCTGAVDIMSAAQKYMFRSFHKTSRLDGSLKRNIKTETVENIKRTSLVLQRTEEEEDAVYLCDLTVIR